MAFVEQRGSEALWWREFWLMVQANEIGGGMHCTASKVDEAWSSCP